MNLKHRRNERHILELLELPWLQLRWYFEKLLKSHWLLLKSMEESDYGIISPSFVRTLNNTVAFQNQTSPSSTSCCTEEMYCMIFWTKTLSPKWKKKQVNEDGILPAFSLHWAVLCQWAQTELEFRLWSERFHLSCHIPKCNSCETEVLMTLTPRNLPLCQTLRWDAGWLAMFYFCHFWRTKEPICWGNKTRQTSQ